jgi:hypothetical protein
MAQHNMKINTTLMAERLLKAIKYLEDTVKNCNTIITELPSEIAKEKNKYLKAKLSLELGDITLRKESVEGLLMDKKKYFENEFMPLHEKQLKECEKEWDYYFNRVKEFAENPENKMVALTLAYKEYMRLNPDHSDEEMKIGFYQGVKQAFCKIDEQKKGKLYKIK